MYLISTSRTATPRSLAMASQVHRVRVTAPAHAASVGLLRRRASALLAAWALDADARTTAELVISELLTNAVLHGRGMMTLTITRTDPKLHLSVTDHGQPRTATPPAEPDEHGRGLAIVAAVTHDLRIDETPAGWCIRACMNLNGPANRR
ncbi:ATP-binding protein [Streptomyces sp. NPDC057798]|uniref:ATP-binding protein n=1 Tax=Streptomyces sp. NPDC057798 TaxID=3346252 RepID=UPI003698889D